MSRRKQIEETTEEIGCDIPQPNFNDILGRKGQYRKVREILKKFEKVEDIALMLDEEVMEHFKKHYYYLSGAGTDDVIFVPKELWPEIKDKLLVVSR